MFHYPVLKYNSQIGGFVTKDFLSNMEKEVFAEHGILNLNRKVQALDMWVKDLARHVVDTILKPKGMFGGSSWIWILLLIGLGLAAVMFGPQIWQSISGAIPHAAGPAATGVGGGAAITPVK